ncbi:MAG: hypothetical protein VKI83_06475 [Synechococcaceae cyanobacterium]|nr:hypothetical protein [Synechococcaceae cyanobacterium]
MPTPPSCLLDNTTLSRVQAVASLTPAIRLRLQEIIGRLGRCEPVSLQERIYVQTFADRDPSLGSWLRRALRMRIDGPSQGGVDGLLAALDLGEPGTDGRFDPDRDDLGDWFSGSPHWLRRS